MRVDIYIVHRMRGNAVECRAFLQDGSEIEGAAHVSSNISWAKLDMGVRPTADSDFRQHDLYRAAVEAAYGPDATVCVLWAGEFEDLPHGLQEAIRYKADEAAAAKRRAAQAEVWG